MVFLEKLSKSGALNFDLNIVRIENEKLSGNQEQIISMDNASSRALDILMSKGKSTGACNKDRDEVKAFFETKNNKFISIWQIIMNNSRHFMMLLKRLKAARRYYVKP